METAKTNAIQRVTFLRWYRTGWENTNGQIREGDLSINYTDDDSKATRQLWISIPDNPAGEAIVYSIAALNGLQIRTDLSSSDEFAWIEWEVGPETPRLHKWVGYEETPLVLGDEQVSVEKCPACGYCNCICEIIDEHEL